MMRRHPKSQLPSSKKIRTHEEHGNGVSFEAQLSLAVGFIAPPTIRLCNKRAGSAVKE